MTEIIVRRALPPLDWTGIPLAIKAKFDGQVSAIVRSEQEAQDLGRWFGDERFCPFQPILMYRRDTATVQLVAGQGYADVAELRDLCVTTWGRTTQRLAENNGRMFDFDALREKNGLMRKEEVDAAMRNALTDRIHEHRANLRTDKPRDPMRDSYERVTFSRYTHGGTA